MIEPVSFFVAGTPKPAGSKRGFYIEKIKRVVITDDCKSSRDWKTDVRHEGQAAYKGEPLACPIALRLEFFVVRPKHHFKTGKNRHLLRDAAPVFPTTKPDVLKLARGVEDALTGIIWKDDAQIVTERITKRFKESPGVMIWISEADS